MQVCIRELAAIGLVHNYLEALTQYRVIANKLTLELHAVHRAGREDDVKTLAIEPHVIRQIRNEAAGVADTIERLRRRGTIILLNGLLIGVDSSDNTLHFREYIIEEYYGFYGLMFARYP